MMIPNCWKLGLALCAALMCASPLAAQTNQGAIVSATVGAAALNSSTNLAIAGAGGFRFNRAMAITVEFSLVPDVESEERFPLPISVLDTLPGVPNGLTRTLGGFSASNDKGGSLTTFTTNLRLEMPTTSKHVLPFAVVGGGVAHLSESFKVTFDIPALSVVVGFPIPVEPISYRQSATDLALTLGGGVSLLKGDHLSFDIDLRYLRLVGEETRDTGRFGGGVTYRF